MNDLEKYFIEHDHRRISKWTGYFDIYVNHFARFIDEFVNTGSETNVLELGIGGGGSLQMWRWYFGKRAHIFGFDIDPEKCFEEDQIVTFVCDCGKREELIKMMEYMPPMDIVIDDASHKMEDQIIAFETLLPYVKPNGIYLVEDVHTSFFPEYGGGANVKRTFLNYIMKRVPQLSAFHGRDQMQIDEFTKRVASIAFYDSVVVITKRSQWSEPRKVAMGDDNE